MKVINGSSQIISERNERFMTLTMLPRLSILAHPLAFHLHVADLICPVFPFNWRSTTDYQIRIAGKSPITPSPIKLPFGSRHAHPRLGAMTPESQPRAELEIIMSLWSGGGINSRRRSVNTSYNHSSLFSLTSEFHATVDLSSYLLAFWEAPCTSTY
jgi:hypothetical protein